MGKMRNAGGGFVVTFPDIPEAITQGETRKEALEMAQEALGAALEFYFEDRRVVPVPARAKRGQDTEAASFEPALIQKNLS
jgi:antitoxin HicB